MRISPALSAILFVIASSAALAQITTSQYDNARTGANLNETALNPVNVNAQQFGRVFRLPVDGDVYAQPLYLRNVDIPGKGRHNVVFIATEHDSVYAFDANGQPLDPLWHISFADRAGGVTAIPQADIGCPFIAPEIGITSTPVIEAATGTLYVLARTRETRGGDRPRYYQRLHAIDVATGRERSGSPVLIRAGVRSKTAGFLGLFEGDLAFNAYKENPRSSLLLVDGTIFITWASSCDFGPYHGWVLTYDARTLRPTGVFNTSPDSSEGGIWASDTGPAADAEGNVYLATGNGRFDAASGGRDYGDSVLKLRVDRSGLALRDYFTPFNQARLNSSDDDLGSGGVVVLPDQPGAHRHLIVVAGKEGTIYLLDRDRLGKFHSGSDAHAVETVSLAGGVFGAPAYWNGKLYFLASGDVLKAFGFDRGQLTRSPVSQATEKFGGPGATPAVSANGLENGIVWAIESRRWRTGDRQATLHAWDASDLRHELYTSDQDFARDAAGTALRFTIPAIADGHVYVGTKGEVDVYGLIAPPEKPRRSRKRHRASRTLLLQ